MAILFYSKEDSPEPWRRALAQALSGMPFRVWPQVGDPEAIRYALVWKPEAALLASLPRLAAILSLGAGVDHLLANPGLPPGVPIVRLVDAGMEAQMSEYCLLGVLYFHRSLDEYARLQGQRIWKRLPGMRAADRRIGIMGLGALGAGLAAKLVALGFDLAGWSRTRKTLDGAACHWGEKALDAFLARSEILVNLLPLTDETRGILNAHRLARLPDGACLINAARGAHLVEDDLLAALDSGKLRGAMLDVFQREPLAETHRFWTHPRILLTPHVAAPTIPELAAEQAVDAIRRLEEGRIPEGLVDVQRGY